MDDIYRFHDIGHILGRHHPLLTVRNAGGHILVRQVNKPLPRQPGFQFLIPLVLEDLEGAFHPPDLLMGGLELPQGDVRPGTHNVPAGLRILNYVEKFQVCRRLGEAQPHPVNELLHIHQFQANQLAAHIVAAHTQPIQFSDHGGPVVFLPGHAEQGLPDLAEQAHIQFRPAVEQL